MRTENQATVVSRNCSSCERTLRKLTAADRQRNYRKKNSDKYFLDL